MAHTPIAQKLRETFAIVNVAQKRNIPVDQVIYEYFEKSKIQQELQKRRSTLDDTIAVPYTFQFKNSIAKGLSAPSIIIVGGGLAGLTCAYQLKQAGFIATIYEAAHRVGGRCWTGRGMFAEEQFVERGGEFIDTNHTAIRQLAQELNLTLDDLIQSETKHTEPFYYFDDTPYSFAEATKDFMKIWTKLKKDISAIGDQTLYNNYTAHAWELDHLSILDWINENIPGGIDSKFGKLLDVAYTIEYGAESYEQSSLNLLYLLGFSHKGPLQIFGPSDERFRIHGGNDQITTLLEEMLQDQIIFGAQLIAIRQNSDGSFTLTFQCGMSIKDVKADKVILTLPFTILRSSVDYRKAGFTQLKKTAIEELGMGVNTKLHLQFIDRHWRDLGCNGETFADTGYQNSWEVSRAQPGKSGILVDYTGGVIGAFCHTGTLISQVRKFLKQIEPVLPGLSEKWNGKATVDYWLGYRWVQGSYSYRKIGQYTKFAGIEAKQEGNCHFAGEHTSIEFQGYLNGAVESGKRAAREIIAEFKPAYSFFLGR